MPFCCLFFCLKEYLSSVILMKYSVILCSFCEMFHREYSQILLKNLPDYLHDYFLVPSLMLGMANLYSTLNSSKLHSYVILFPQKSVAQRKKCTKQQQF